MLKTTEVAIVGGGAIGCSIAYYLSRRGVKSTVFEKGRFASGASGATAGVICPAEEIDRFNGPLFNLGLKSMKMFPGLASELLEAGIDPEFRQTGILTLAFTPEQVESIRENLVWQAELGLGMMWLEADDVKEREPEITPGVLGGVFSPAGGSIILH